MNKRLENYDKDLVMDVSNSLIRDNNIYKNYLNRIVELYKISDILKSDYCIDYNMYANLFMKRIVEFNLYGNCVIENIKNLDTDIVVELRNQTFKYLNKKIYNDNDEMVEVHKNNFEKLETANLKTYRNLMISGFNKHFYDDESLNLVNYHLSNLSKNEFNSLDDLEVNKMYNGSFDTINNARATGICSIYTDKTFNGIQEVLDIFTDNIQKLNSEYQKVNVYK